MSIHLCMIMFLLTTIIVSNVNSDDPIQEYVIHRDGIKAFKAAELSVYDKSEKRICYRIESNRGLLQNIKVISNSPKQVIGRLEAKLKLVVYKAEFSILDPKSKKWVSGTIEEKFMLMKDFFDIQWGNYRISMKMETFSYTTQFFDSNGELLAQFRLRPASVFWTKKYDMKIFSNKYPEQIYLLGMAVQDHRKSRRG